MNCRNCGKAIQTGDEFCVHCGAPVSGDPRLRQESPSSFFSSAGGITLIIAIAVIVMGGIALAIVLAVSNGGEGDRVTDQANQQTWQPQENNATITDQDQDQVSDESSGNGGQSSQTQESGQEQSSADNQTASTNNQTPDDCYAALLEFARQSAAGGPIPIDPASVRLEYFSMESPTLGVAGAYGYATDFGVEEFMGACWAEYIDGTWVCWWETN